MFWNVHCVFSFNIITKNAEALFAATLTKIFNHICSRTHLKRHNPADEAEHGMKTQQLSTFRKQYVRTMFRLYVSFVIAHDKPVPFTADICENMQCVCPIQRMLAVGTGSPIVNQLIDTGHLQALRQPLKPLTQASQHSKSLQSAS